jgi:hypothetical protein
MDAGTSKPKYRYRVTNWAEYDRALVSRGDLTIWFDEATIKDGWTPPPPRGRPGTPPMTGLPVGTQYALKARFAGDIDPFVGQCRDDARRRLISETRRVGHREDACALLFAQRMRGQRTFGLGPAVAHLQAILSLPALQRAHGDARFFAGRAQARAGRVSGLDVADQCLAIFQADHASSSLSVGKIAASFFLRTKSAAASASAFSLRCSSRSSSLMRRCQCRFKTDTPFRQLPI